MDKVVCKASRVCAVFTDGDRYWFDRQTFDSKEDAEDHYGNIHWLLPPGVKVAEYVEAEFVFDTKEDSSG